MKKFMTKRVINQTMRKKLSVKMTSVIVMLLFSMLTATSVHAYDWEGVNISDLSMTGEGYFEARVTYNAMENLKISGLNIQGGGFTLTSVDLIKSDGTTVNLSSGSATNIDRSKFNNVEEGDYIRCSYSDKQNNYNPSFSLQELNNSIYKDGVASNEVYIYNVETGKFMYIGGAWGTHIELLYSDLGFKFKMNKDGDRYVFTSDIATEGGGTTGGYLGMMQGYTGTDANSNGIVADKQKATIRNDKSIPKYCYSRFNVVPVAGQENTYTLSLKPGEYPQGSYAGENGYYNQIVPQNTIFYLGVEDGQHVVETTNANEASHWRFVSVREIDEAVRNAALEVDAFNGMNLDVTYKIANQGFNRNNENKWDENGANYLKKGQNNYILLDPPTNGKYYYGLMYSASEGGTITRTFTAPATGWYKVQCQGVSKSGNGFAYAQANGNEAVTVPLNVVAGVESYNAMVSDAHKQDRVDLGIDFYDNKYPVEVFVYAEEGMPITIGIQQKAAYDPNNDLTAFDDFQIKYLGEVFVLDEDYTECTDANEYTTGKNGATVILHRTFSKKDDGTYYWNTLTLPIDMTGTQVKNVFGDDVKLAVASGLDQSDPYVITFQSVDADNGIQAGQFYLIQPAKEPATPAGQTITINNKTYNGPLYTLGRRDVNPISGDLFNDNGWPAPNHNSIRYHGTYLKKAGGVPARSYVFSKGDMYHTKTAQTIKGFRFWIEDEEAAQGGSAKPFTLSIGGVEDQQEAGLIITTISEVETVTSDNAAVYSLSGQFLGKGKQLLNGLPKGIYMVNNKKYMVK